MTDTTNEAPERIWFVKVGENIVPNSKRTSVEDVEYVRADLVQAAVAAERERAYNAGRKHERDLIYAFAQRMDTEGKAYAEQILAAIREGGE